MKIHLHLWLRLEPAEPGSGRLASIYADVIGTKTSIKIADLVRPDEALCRQQDTDECVADGDD